MAIKVYYSRVVSDAIFGVVTVQECESMDYPGGNLVQSAKMAEQETLRR